MRELTVAPPLRTGEAGPLTSRKLRCTIGVQVVLIHCLVIFGPLGLVLYQNWRSPQESAFKVKLIGPLSTGEEVGPPSRLRPVENASPEPPAPSIPAPPAPQVRKQTPAPPVVKPQTRKPTPNPPVVKRQTPKPTPKPKRQTTRPKQQTTRKVSKPSRQTSKPRQLSAAEQVALARAAAEKRGGGSNRNLAVPIGDADRAQAYGKQNNATPGGGAQGEDRRYWDRLGNYIKSRWSEPPGSLLGDARPQVTIQLSIAADGRVTNARILARSGNVPMDESVQRLLANLDRVPAPSNGSTSVQLILRTED